MKEKMVDWMNANAKYGFMLPIIAAFVAYFVFK